MGGGVGARKLLWDPSIYGGFIEMFGALLSRLYYLACVYDLINTNASVSYNPDNVTERVRLGQ